MVFAKKAIFLPFCDSIYCRIFAENGFSMKNLLLIVALIVGFASCSEDGSVIHDEVQTNIKEIEALQKEIKTLKMLIEAQTMEIETLQTKNMNLRNGVDHNSNEIEQLKMK